MNKSNFLRANVNKPLLVLIAVAGTFAGLLWSRAVLSLSVMLLGVVGLWGVSPARWLKQRWWLIGVLWVACYFVSGFWSTDMHYWSTRCEVKLPVLLLPLAFSFLPGFSQRHRLFYSLALNLLVLGGSVYSLYFLFSDPVKYVAGYDYSNVLPTIIENDHIVFSLVMAVCIIWNIYLMPTVRRRLIRYLLAIATLLHMVMLHVLAVRSGLVAFYLFIGAWSIYMAFSRRYRWAGISLLLGFMLAAAASVHFVPTLRNRLEHFNYTLQMYREGNISGDYSDLGRYMSYDLALKLIQKHPVKGVGAGEMLDSMKAGYSRYYPQVPEEQRLIPHNQFLSVALGCGLPAMLLFTVWVFYPLFRIRRSRSGFFFFATWLALLLPLLVEPLLEIQFGVFVYLFFLLWQRHAMRQDHAMLQC